MNNRNIIAKYLDIMADQQNEIDNLKKENKKLDTLHKSTKALAAGYKDMVRQKQEELDEQSERIGYIMSQPIGKIEIMLKAYKENMG